MNRKICKQNIEDIEKIKGRSASFGVTVESKSEREFIFSSSPQQIAMEFLSLININIFSTNSEYNNLYSFIDYLRDFDEEKKPKTLRLNQLTLGTAQTKTISQRFAFNIVEKKVNFIDFLKNEFPDRKIN